MTTHARLHQGDIVLVNFPFTDLSESKLRPALIVGRVNGDDLILAFITSRGASALSAAECLIAPPDPEFRNTGLKVPSVVRLDKLMTLHRRLVRRRLGIIGVGMQQQIDVSLRYVFDL
jgi:mRNA interferase MazF